MGASVSVALCTYNGTRYLKDQIDSIASQTRVPHELVVCDDCSSDDTVKILEAFASRAPFPVRLSVNPTNLGSTKNFAQAIALCRGDIIALCDQDDVWHPAKLERLASVFAVDGCRPGGVILRCFLPDHDTEDPFSGYRSNDSPGTMAQAVLAK